MGKQPSWHRDKDTRRTRKHPTPLFTFRFVSFRSRFKMLTLSNTNQVCTTSRATKVVGLKRAGGRKQVVRTHATNNLEDSQVFAAVFISLLAGIMATRLGNSLY